MPSTLDCQTAWKMQHPTPQILQALIVISNDKPCPTAAQTWHEPPVFTFIKQYTRWPSHALPKQARTHSNKTLLLLQAKLYEARQDFEAAEQLYRANLARLERGAIGDGSMGLGAGLAGREGMAALGGPAAQLFMGADAVEALLFLAGRCKVCDIISSSMLV